MVGLEAGDGRVIAMPAVQRLQVGVALGTGRVGEPDQGGVAAVFMVTVRTPDGLAARVVGERQLLGVMESGVVAFETSRIADRGGVDRRPQPERRAEGVGVADLAMVGEQGVGRGDGGGLEGGAARAGLNQTQATAAAEAATVSSRTTANTGV